MFSAVKRPFFLPDCCQSQSSQENSKAHNLKVEGSNPSPATTANSLIPKTSHFNAYSAESLASMRVNTFKVH